MGIQLCTQVNQVFPSVTTDGIYILGPCHTEKENEQPRQMFLVCRLEQNHYFFAARGEVQAMRDQAQNKRDRDAYERALHEFDWAVAMIPNWGKAYRYPEEAAPLNHHDKRLKKEYLSLVRSSQPEGFSAP